MNRSYGVYVIQLTAVGEPPDHGHLPHIYVGQSWYSQEERLEQHRDEYWTASRTIRGKVWRLRPELCADLPRVASSDYAIALEEGRARRLAEAGFTVRCNGVVPKVPANRLRPWTEAELEGVDDALLDLARIAAAAAHAPLAIDELVHVLRWKLHGPVDELVTTPNEAIGRFAHVEEAALRRRLAGLSSQLALG